jgi:hypothetical protein
MSVLPLGIKQPDARSCGAASLVAARMLVDPEYAELVTEGVHPRTRFALSGTAASRFAHETLAMHRRVTGVATLAGGLQVPWPRAVGTPPWAVEHQLSMTSGPGLPPTPYATLTVRGNADLAAPVVRAGLDSGRPVAVFVGDGWLPRHVVLAVDVTGDSIGCYDPARGRVVAAGTRAFAARQLPFGRWTTAWFVVAPR